MKTIWYAVVCEENAYINDFGSDNFDEAVLMAREMIDDYCHDVRIREIEICNDDDNVIVKEYFERDILEV